LPPPAEEIVLPFPTPVVPARHMRSTILLGSIASVRDTGRYDDYVAGLSPASRDVLLNAVAGVWIPLSIAASHYEACDALGLPVDQQVHNGRATFDKTRGTLLGTMLRMARGTGVTPWDVIPYFQRFWERGYDGGGIGAAKLGPKEARLEVVGVQLLETRYYRNVLRGLATGVTELFCSKAYITERPGHRSPGSIALRVQWA
jgi:hypothetical protein